VVLNEGPSSLIGGRPQGCKKKKLTEQEGAHPCAGEEKDLRRDKRRNARTAVLSGQTTERDTRKKACEERIPYITKPQALERLRIREKEKTKKYRMIAPVELEAVEKSEEKGTNPRSPISSLSR